MGKHPIMVKRRELTDQEIEDPSNRGAKGVKTFYFYFTHIKGSSNMQENQYYQDWSWITRDESNQFFTEDQHNRFVYLLSRY